MRAFDPVRKKWVAVGSAFILAGLGASAFAASGEAGNEKFKSVDIQKSFCSTAGSLDLESSVKLSPHDRNHIVEDLARDAPDSIRPSFDVSVAWYKEPHPEDEERARKASYRVGEFIEKSCSVNLGGIRS